MIITQNNRKQVHFYSTSSTTSLPNLSGWNLMGMWFCTVPLNMSSPSFITITNGNNNMFNLSGTSGVGRLGTDTEFDSPIAPEFSSSASAITPTNCTSYVLIAEFENDAN